MRMSKLAVLVPPSPVDTAVHQPPEPDMVVYPRPSGLEEWYKFEVNMNGTYQYNNKVAEKKMKDQNDMFLMVRDFEYTAEINFIICLNR